MCPLKLFNGLMPDQYPEFRGLVLGLLESHHRDTNELRVDVVILDCTHKRFVFQPFLGDEAQQRLDSLHKIATATLCHTGDFLIRWYWKNKEGISYAVCRYGLKIDGLELDEFLKPVDISSRSIPIAVVEEPNFPPYVELLDSINSLWHFITEWQQTAQEGDIPTIPKSLKKSIRLLEHQCIVAMQEDYQLCH